MLAAGLTRALVRAGIPMVGVSIGRDADRETWRCHFADGATAKHHADAAAILAGYELATDTTLKDEQAADQIDNLKAIKAAVVCALWGAAQSPAHGSGDQRRAHAVS